MYQFLFLDDVQRYRTQIHVDHGGEHSIKLERRGFRSHLAPAVQPDGVMKPKTDVVESV